MKWILKEKMNAMNEINKKKKLLIGVAALFAIVMVLTSLWVFPGYSNAAQSKAVVSTKGARLNVRTGPSVNYQVVGKLNNGTKVTVTESSNGWYRIRYGSGKTGYVSGKYLKLDGDSVSYPVTAKVTAGGVPLNLRRSATTSSAILIKIPRGSSITITGKYNSSWYSASYGGKSGYVYASYIVMPDGSGGTTVNVNSGSSTSSGYKYTKNVLNVSKYSQFDSRWSGLRLGKSSATISQSGCVVCGLAQIETYLQRTQITPADMLKRLSFDSEGRVYWPAGYQSYSGSDYLQYVYNQLKNGNPVLAGAFTPAGKQHWVLITGYNKNSNSLSASDFLINDCSDRYSTLAAFQSKYSRFYKIVYKTR